MIAIPLDAGRRDRGRKTDHAIEIVSHPMAVATAEVISLWVSDRRAIQMNDDQSVAIIGNIHSSGTDNTISYQGAINFSEMRPDKISSDIVRLAWGEYILLLSSARDREIYAMRDPVGMMPCYILSLPDRILISSDISTLMKYSCKQAKVNWGILFRHLQNPERRLAATCLREVTELSPGCLYPLVSGQEPRRIWNPWVFAKTGSTGSGHLAGALRDTICNSISAWAEMEDHIIVPASGGLDSSIICAALAAGGHAFSCCTIATADPSGDERAYVRRLGEWFHVPVVEEIFDPASIDPCSATSRHLPRPVRKAFMQQIEGMLRRTATQSGTRLVLDGNGGDNLFCYLHSSLPVVDRLKSEGIGRGVWQTLLDMCRITQCDIQTMATMALRQSLRRLTPYEWPDDDSFLAENLNTGGSSKDLADYLTLPPPSMPGKRAHVALLTRIQSHVEGLDREHHPQLLSPLLSQPVVELCLSIPTWHWAEGGINRSLARDAFRDLLPPDVLSRTSKAGPDSAIFEMFAINRGRIRDHLLEGNLAAQKLIDARKLEKFFSDSRPCDHETIYRILDIAEAEAWTRIWT